MDDDSAQSKSVATCANYLKALGDPVRLQIVRALQTSPMTVSDIAELMEIDIAKASHHLRVLFHANLVTIKKDGKYSYYQLNDAFIKQRSVNKTLDFGCCKIDLRD